MVFLKHSQQHHQASFVWRSEKQSFWKVRARSGNSHETGLGENFPASLKTFAPAAMYLPSVRSVPLLLLENQASGVPWLNSEGIRLHWNLISCWGKLEHVIQPHGPGANSTRSACNKRKIAILWAGFLLGFCHCLRIQPSCTLSASCAT